MLPAALKKIGTLIYRSQEFGYLRKSKYARTVTTGYSGEVSNTRSDLTQRNSPQ